jgi:hypothetical protein
MISAPVEINKQIQLWHFKTNMFLYWRADAVRGGGGVHAMPVLPFRLVDIDPQQAA